MDSLSLSALQSQYRLLCAERSWEENALETMLLLTEELGELARGVRQEQGLARDGGYQDSNIAEEISDVLLYLVHLANYLGIDLAAAVAAKLEVLRDRA